ncbi:DUF4286 family protein [Emticicia sp. 21SJ11W-3]|uniref:DUF4286 family protein n=1 Tax=Emticicia sp. 21SJ11W-3 TaxID=2916755 RepID=UPI00209C7CCF|nr:DUF4286 family protein [Emticicia sp. 21SJ11W-3]UTA69427.1 DUF4286 family protein [Emticicia sp. 21SJ11W-3]
MFLFNITFNVESGIHQQWLKWMKTHFAPAVMQTNLPTHLTILKLLTEIDNGGSTFSFQFHFNTMEDFLNFDLNHKELLLERHNIFFRGKTVQFSTLLEEIETVTP